jgi:hypothetical protein
MEIVNKPAILISWPRELDMFSAFIDNVLGDAIIVVDDFIYIENEKFENGKNIIEIIDGKVEYVLLSDVIGKFKYRILFSTGSQTYQKKVTLGSYFKYLYAIYIGSLIERFGLSNFFLEIINRPLTGGGKGADKFGKFPIERLIGEKVVKYPKGLDINKSKYPENQWKDIFDIYLCHSNIDQNLITDKFYKAKCIKIGYPRYDNVPSINEAKKNIYNEIRSIDSTKPLILWMPTFIKINGKIIDNIEAWIPIIEKLLDKYNVLISVHPKLAVMNPAIVTYLTELGFLVDATKGRNLGTLYQSADLVLADYGGPVLSTIYMKKKLILLNSPNTEYANWRKERMYVDDDVRNDVYSFDINDSMTFIEQINTSIEDNDILKRDILKAQYFGKDCNYEELKEIFHKLTSHF